MSTQINITIGDQRLLQQNKTRAAANQQALDDRTATKKTEAAATKQVTAQQEELPGAVPENVVPRRPTAQRKKVPASYIVYRVNSPVLSIVPNTEQVKSQEWTGYRSRAYYSNTPPYGLVSADIYNDTRYNSYNINTLSTVAVFEQEKKTAILNWPGETHYQYNNVVSMDWTLRQRSYPFAGVPSVYGNPPELEFLFENMIYGSQLYGTPLISTDPTNIYVSARVLHFIPDGASLRTFTGTNISIYDSTAYEADNNLNMLSSGQALRRTGFQLQRIYVWTHLHWKFNVQTKVAAFKKYGVFDKTVSASAADYLNNLYASDPQYTMWTAYKQEFSGLSNATLAAQYLYSTAAPYKKWPKGLVYYPADGTVTLTTRTFQTYYYRVFTIKIPPNSSQATVAALLPATYNQDNASTTTDQDFLLAGWKLEKELTDRLPASGYNYVALQS